MFCNELLCGNNAVNIIVKGKEPCYFPHLFPPQITHCFSVENFPVGDYNEKNERLLFSLLQTISE